MRIATDETLRLIARANAELEAAQATDRLCNAWWREFHAEGRVKVDADTALLEGTMTLHEWQAVTTSFRKRDPNKAPRSADWNAWSSARDAVLAALAKDFGLLTVTT